MTDELEPLDSSTASLLSALPKVPLAPELKAKLWVRVEASAIALPPVAAQVVTVPPAAKLLGAGVAGKLVMPAVIGALVAGGATGIAIDRVVRKPEVIVRYVDVPVKHDEPVAPPLPEPPPPPSPDPEPVRAPVVKPKPAPVAEVPSSGERGLLEMTRTALVKHDAPAALDAIAKHRAKFPRGQLAEERDALEVQALAIAGRAEDAKAAASRFFARYPHSVFEDSVSAAVK